MEIGVFIPSGSQFDNDIPEPSRRRGNPFWTFLTPVLGLQPEHLPWDNEGVSPNIARIREYEARRAEANNSVPFKPTFGEVVSEVVEAVREAVKKTKPRDRAMTWLREQLEELGPTLAVEIERRAKAAKINLRTLRRA